MNPENPSDEPSRVVLALRRSSLFSSLSDEVLTALETQLTHLTLICGEVLFREGDPSDSLYIVISGRLLVSQVADDQTERIVVELGHGEIVGEMGLVCNEPRSATVVASRDANLARLTETGLNRLAASYAKPIYSAIIRQLASRLRDGIRTRKPAPRCVAIVGLSRDVPIAPFADSLTSELARAGVVPRLNSERVDSLFGTPGAAQSSRGDAIQARFVDWLSGQETRHSKLVMRPTHLIPSGQRDVYAKPIWCCS